MDLGEKLHGVDLLELVRSSATEPARLLDRNEEGPLLTFELDQVTEKTGADLVLFVVDVRGLSGVVDVEH